MKTKRNKKFKIILGENVERIEIEEQEIEKEKGKKKQKKKECIRMVEIFKDVIINKEID